MGTLCVRVVSPCPLLGEALTRLIGGFSRFEAAWDPLDAIGDGDATPPDVVLVDIDGADGPGDLGRRIQQRWPGVIMVELVRAGGGPARRTPLAGAAATLGGRLQAEELAACLRRIREHGRLPPGAETVRREPAAADPERAAVTRLTDRETEVLRLLASGQGAAEMAGCLGLSVNTVRAHVQNLFLKLGVHTRLEAVALARRAGLASGPPAAAAGSARRPDHGDPAGAPVRGTGSARVLVADGRPLVRAALRAGLDAEEGVVVVAEAGSADDAVAGCRRLRPDVAVLDARLPPAGGVAGCALVKSEDLPTRVLVVSEHADEDCLLATVEAGGDGYSEWSGGVAGLASDVRRLRDGESCIPPGMLGVLLRRLIQRGRQADLVVDRFSRLSRREREILALMVEGMDNQAIARALVISPHTARTHVQNVLGKLDVHSRVEAAAVAMEFGLIERFMGAS